MKKERLLKLAKMLEADAKNPNGIRFDLQYWAEDRKRSTFPSKKRVLNCNTNACAIGLACLSGAFKAEGLTWQAAKDENNITPLFEGAEDFDAVNEFFELSTEESLWLFGASYYGPDFRTGAKGERAVAKRLRDFVAGKATP